jgi:hypothetical protein
MLRISAPRRVVRPRRARARHRHARIDDDKAGLAGKRQQTRS